MKILKNIYDEMIFSCKPSFVEVGGPIGSKDNIIIAYKLDIGEYCRYSPNTENISNIICKWKNESIEFCGIFHTHPQGEKLSQADIEYINRIMLGISDYYNFLYFPIVIPHKSMIPYKAVFESGKVEITDDELVII